MYVPKHFSETDISVLHALISAQPLGTWVTQGSDELLINHIPFYLEADRGDFGTLIGHVARANPVWKTLMPPTASVVIFQGPQAYISPSWYPSKEVDGKVVPTWNYVVAHAHGQPRIIEDRTRLLELVTHMTGIHEAGQAAPWKVSDAPPEFIDTLLGAIVGIEIPITRLTGKSKVSQNRPAPDQRGTEAGLQAQGCAQADEMARLIAGSAAQQRVRG